MTRRSVFGGVLLVLAIGGVASYGFYRLTSVPMFVAHDGSISPDSLPEPQDGGSKEIPSAAVPAETIELLPYNGEILDAAGTRDLGNKYLSTVIVSLQEPLDGAECSGVIIGPQQVLTAAHCVCKPERSSFKEGELTVVDSTHCPKQAYASIVRYGTVRSKLIADSELRIYSGSVRPHPEFKIVTKPDGTISSISADLAMIVLDKPFGQKFPVLPIEEARLQSHDVLIMAGYGHGEEWGGGYHRYFRKNKVVGPEGLSQDRFIYEQQGAYLYHGFDGGPCFREQGTRQWLTGITSMGSDKALTLTSTFAHRAWIEAEMLLTPH